MTSWYSSQYTIFYIAKVWYSMLYSTFLDARWRASEHSTAGAVADLKYHDNLTWMAGQRRHGPGPRGWSTWQWRRRHGPSGASEKWRTWRTWSIMTTWLGWLGNGVMVRGHVGGRRGSGAVVTVPQGHQQKGECIILQMLHITFMLTYLAYFCIFCAYKCKWRHRINTYGVTAYFCLFVHILCIFKFA